MCIELRPVLIGALHLCRLAYTYSRVVIGIALSDTIPRGLAIALC